MKSICLMLVTLMVSVSLTCAQENTDVDQIKKVVASYAECFYLTKPELASVVAHPQMAKRTIQSFNDNTEFLKNMTVEEMINLAKVFNQRGNFSANSKKEITILDMMDKTASVKLSAEGWVDYMHLGKINGEWKIINILWQRDQ